MCDPSRQSIYTCSKIASSFVHKLIVERSYSGALSVVYIHLILATVPFVLGVRIFHSYGHKKVRYLRTESVGEFANDPGIICACRW